jgi:hypothetical protein
MKDEARHEAYSLELVRALGGSLARAQGWELKRRWLRAGAVLSGGLFHLLTSLLYLLLAPVAVLEKRGK